MLSAKKKGKLNRTAFTVFLLFLLEIVLFKKTNEVYIQRLKNGFPAGGTFIFMLVALFFSCW
jgi:hypothetical protein